MRWTKIFAIIGLSTIWTGVAAASERRFAYTYESAVLGPEQIEFEPWTTARIDRADFYRRFDERLEFEIGLTARLQTSLYLNFTALGQGPADARTSSFEFEGISSEWKFKLTDPVAHAVGSALYFEVRVNALEAELEGKVILDKRMGNWLGALNLVAEHEWSVAHPDVEQETVLELDAGLAWLISHNWSVGLEARNVNRLGDDGYSVIFAGPVASYAAKSWWVALAIQPQLVALRGATRSGLNLYDHERLEARLLLGFHL